MPSIPVPQTRFRFHAGKLVSVPVEMGFRLCQPKYEQLDSFSCAVYLMLQHQSFGMDVVYLRLANFVCDILNSVQITCKQQSCTYVYNVHIYLFCLETHILAGNSYHRE